MERQRLAVTKRVGIWGSVYIIGGTEIDGEMLSSEQADDLIARFEHEQALFGRMLNYAAGDENGHINAQAAYGIIGTGVSLLQSTTEMCS
jgi:hypothetical protein